MTLPSLLPLAGAAIAPVLGKVIDGVTEGLSFLDVLHEQEQNAATDSVEAAEPDAFQHDFIELADRLRERFSQLGIDLSTPLRLKQDGRERVVVDGDHPDRVLIESVFRADEELTNLFTAVADSAAGSRRETGSGITKEFRFVLGPTDALIEFA
ncbi:MAG: hypothetical protein O3C40_19055 [Planctomycetota bacterium]|nr:hypothetical protein [Planctomycetota bacterium]